MINMIKYYNRGKNTNDWLIKNILIRRGYFFKKYNDPFDKKWRTVNKPVFKTSIIERLILGDVPKNAEKEIIEYTHYCIDSIFDIKKEEIEKLIEKNYIPDSDKENILLCYDKIQNTANNFDFSKLTKEYFTTIKEKYKYNNLPKIKKSKEHISDHKIRKIYNKQMDFLTEEQKTTAYTFDDLNTRLDTYVNYEDNIDFFGNEYIYYLFNEYMGIYKYFFFLAMFDDIDCCAKKSFQRVKSFNYHKRQRTINKYYFKGLTTNEEIKKKYREYAKKYHPDLNKNNSLENTEIFEKITNEYNQLIKKSEKTYAAGVIENIIDDDQHEGFYYEQFCQFSVILKCFALYDYLIIPVDALFLFSELGYKFL